ncbi:HTH-type transcriptional regulator YesS [compost metagenome]
MRWLENSELEQGYFMGVLQLDHYLKLNEEWSIDEKRLWLFAIRNIVSEWSLNQGGLTAFPFHSGEWVILFPDNLSARKVCLGNDLIGQIKTNTKLSCSAGFSQSINGIDQLNEAYQCAAKALYQRFYSGEEGVYVYSESDEILSTLVVKYPKHLEESLLECVRKLDRQQMLNLFDEMKSYFEGQALTKEQAERMIVELTIVLYRQFEGMNLLLEWSLEGLLQEIHSLPTLSEMIAVLKDCFGQWMMESKENYSRGDVQAVIAKVTSYITHNYHKDLSIEEVCELAELSISHFCMLFKQETGYTFLEYLTQCRIEKAKFILQNTNVKVYQVAPLVGYQDPRYFSQVFKKLTGKTPSEYREEAG